MLLCEDVTSRVIGAAMEVHRRLGPGLLESAYEQCLCHELGLLGLTHERQVDLPIFYKDVEVPAAFRVDVIVERSVLLELKSVDRLAAIHESQLLTYLRFSGIRVGLLFNFNTRLLRNGIVRRVI